IYGSVIRRIAGFALVLVGGLLIAVFVMNADVYYVLAAIAAVALGLILVRNVQRGLAAYFFFAALAFGMSPAVHSPHSGYESGVMPSEVFLAFLTILWLGRAVFNKELTIVKSDLNIPLFALVTVSFLSLLANNVFRGTRELLFHQMLITQVAEVGLLCLSVCAYFLVANNLREEWWLRFIQVPIVLLALYFSVHRIFDIELPVPVYWGSFLLAAGIGIVYAHLLFSRLNRCRAILLSTLLAVLLYAAYNNLSWVSGWIAVSGVIMVVSLLKSRWLAGVLFVIALLAIFVWPGIYQTVHDESEGGGDFDRFVIWQDAFRMFMSVNPVLGVGPGNYHPYVYYHNTIWFGGRTYTTAHSNYVQMASELGLVGLIVFLWVVIAGIRTGLKAWKACPADFRWLVATATAVFASMAV
ncbi:MAG: O-antigen ligase family protein, partial [Armatimonadota bacterium]